MFRFQLPLCSSIGLIVVFASSLLGGHASEVASQRGEDTLQAMKRATEYYRTQVASHGGYVYHYSIDLTQRWGEGKATKDQIWVQPPGTPTVGLAYVAAYKATGDRYYLEAIDGSCEGSYLRAAQVRRLDE